MTEKQGWRLIDVLERIAAALEGLSAKLDAPAPAPARPEPVAAPAPGESRVGKTQIPSK